MEYQAYKAELEAKYNVRAEWDYDRQPINEPARLLTEFRLKQLHEGKAKKRLAAKESTMPEEGLSQPVLEPNKAVTALGKLSGFTPLESDLEEFLSLDKDILRVYLVNQEIEPKTLANSFGKSYQYIAKLINSKAVQLLRAKYFHKQLDNNTKIGLLKLTQEADPKIVLASAEYLKILHDNESKDDSASRIQDPKAEKALRLLGDWLADDCKEPLTIKSEDLETK